MKSKVLSEINEMIIGLIDYLKNSYLSHEKPDSDFAGKLNEISDKLNELDLIVDLKYFLSISHMLKYIVYDTSSSDYYDFAVELLEFFRELFKTNMNHYDEFQKIQNDYKMRHLEFKREFYLNIYDDDGTFNQEEMYALAKSLDETSKLPVLNSGGMV